jgi:hypothetical protein
MTPVIPRTGNAVVCFLAIIMDLSRALMAQHAAPVNGHDLALLRGGLVVRTASAKGQKRPVSRHQFTGAYFGDDQSVLGRVLFVSFAVSIVKMLSSLYDPHAEAGARRGGSNETSIWFWRHRRFHR